jgi:mannose-1-phosphate guanylyltransferase
MAGGSGERFWPLSTKENPKQLLSLVSKKSMIRETVDRILDIVDITDIFVATNNIQVPGVIRELPDIPVENIIIEPSFRDTAAAIIYGSTYIAKYEADPTIVVLASDHLISNKNEFLRMIKISEKEANNGSIVTLGITPNKPETGYGYIKVPNPKIGYPSETKGFLEKPRKDKALEYFQSGDYVWNSGMFVFKYNTIYKEMNTYLPNHINVIESMKDKITSLTGIELSNAVKSQFETFEKISIDFSVMEKSNIIKCVPVDFGWNDIGGYNSLEEVFTADNNNNIIKECTYICIDSQHNIVISDNKDRIVSTIGIYNTIIVETKTALLICNRGDAQRVKELLKKMN